MRRAIVVVLLALAPIAALLFVMADEVGAPSNHAQTALDKYLAYKHYTLRLEQFDQASRPWNFTREMSAFTIGDSARYLTHADFSGNLRREATRFAAQAANSQVPSSAQDGRIPLPYPPEEVWCASLASDESRLVVFVVLHQDLYNGAWIVHEPEGALTSHELSENLSSLGCDLNP